ncbi:uncharacterized protein LOC124275156 [Haliotis rubra]|uniref:uncharacterized protein LOC124275156 n=1 Tax=Haliotis rubra TaxID=36100 RepID=UPI001EE5E752|nr:uncharacterized protein LOC124275156 [Haliotis rubra]
MKSLVLLSLTLILVWEAEGGCVFSRLDVTEVEGDLLFHCPYLDLLLRPGQKGIASDCKLCTCSMRGLQCCGIGRYSASVMPEWCQVVRAFNNRCGYRVVRTDDHSIDC